MSGSSPRFLLAEPDGLHARQRQLHADRGSPVYERHSVRDGWNASLRIPHNRPGKRRRQPNAVVVGALPLSFPALPRRRTPPTSGCWRRSGVYRSAPSDHGLQRLASASTRAAKPKSRTSCRARFSTTAGPNARLNNGCALPLSTTSTASSTRMSRTGASPRWNLDLSDTMEGLRERALQLAVVHRRRCAVGAGQQLCDDPVRRQRAYPPAKPDDLLDGLRLHDPDQRADLQHGRNRDHRVGPQPPTSTTS